MDNSNLFKNNKWRKKMTMKSKLIYILTAMFALYLLVCAIFELQQTINAIKNPAIARNLIYQNILTTVTAFAPMLCLVVLTFIRRLEKIRIVYLLISVSYIILIALGATNREAIEDQRLFIIWTPMTIYSFYLYYFGEEKDATYVYCEKGFVFLTLGIEAICFIRCIALDFGLSLENVVSTIANVIFYSLLHLSIINRSKQSDEAEDDFEPFVLDSLESILDSQETLEQRIIAIEERLTKNDVSSE